MADFTSLLPPNSTRLERALEAAAALGKPDVSSLSSLFDPMTCPAELLPWLAWSFRVANWNSGWPEARKRSSVAAARDVRKLQGTYGAVERALDALGFDADIIPHSQLVSEWQAAGGYFLDGAAVLDGSWSLGAGAPGQFRHMTGHWSEFLLDLNVADGELDPISQRAVFDAVDDAKRLTSRLVAILYYAGVYFSAEIVHQLEIGGAEQVPGWRVPDWLFLDGTWDLSGDYEPLNLDGSWWLTGARKLTGQQPIGPELNRVWGRFNVDFKSGPEVELGGGYEVEPPLLDGGKPLFSLDGSWWLGSELLDGHRDLDGGWSMDIAVLRPDHDLRLDGSWWLGDVVPADSGVSLAVSARMIDRMMIVRAV